MDKLVCWYCGQVLTEVPLPLARAADCPACHRDLHVCKACRHYDPAVAHSCREPVAEGVTDKTRANFCGYFQPNPDAYRPTDTRAAQNAQAQLHALFGTAAGKQDGEEPAGDDAEAQQRAALDALFRRDE